MGSQDSTESAPPVRSDVRRRTLLRAGTHAAWALPAVQVITQSPAYAVSGPAALRVTASSTGWTGPSTSGARFTVTTTVSNLNTRATTDLRVTYQLPTGVTATATAPAGWTVVSGQGTNVIVLDKTDPQLAGNTSTAPFSVVFDPIDSSVGTAIPVVVTAAPGGTGTSGQTSVTVPASPPVLTITPTGDAWSSGNNFQMIVPTRTISNTGYQPAVGLTVTLTINSAFPRGVTSATAPGWTVSPFASGAKTITFTKSPVPTVGHANTVTFAPTLVMDGNTQGQSGTITMTVSSPGATSAVSTAVR